MDKIIKYFVEEKNVTQVVAQILSKTLVKYVDIKEEFIFWIDNRTFNVKTPIAVSGYTAMDISRIAPHLDAAGVYNFMVTLRDNPKKAQECIDKGFPTK